MVVGGIRGKAKPPNRWAVIAIIVVIIFVIALITKHRRYSLNFFLGPRREGSIG